MIKARELHYGMFVRNRKTKEPIQVKMVTRKKIGYHASGNNTSLSYVRLSEIEPIPITSDFLEYNNFTLFESNVNKKAYEAKWIDYDEKLHQQKETYCHVVLYDDGTATIETCYEYLKCLYRENSVHRLQAILSMTDMFNHGETIRIRKQ